MPANFALEPTPARPGVPRKGSGRRRDRRGRTGRGALLPPGLPASVSRQERFEDLVTDSAERIRERWERKLSAAVFEVALVPDAGSLARAAARGEAPPLGSVLGGSKRRPAHIVIFRRPVETVAGSQQAIPWLVHDVLVELVSELLGLPPEEVDPGYRGAPDEQ